METLENRTRGGAGALARMCHGLGEAVRGVFRGGTAEPIGKAEETSEEKSLQDFFESCGIACARTLSENDPRYEIVVESGAPVNVYALKGGKRTQLDRANPQAEFALKIFVLLERCFWRQRQQRRLIRLKLTLAYVDSHIVLAETSSLVFEPDQSLSRRAMVAILQRSDIKTRRVAAKRAA